MLCSAPQHRLCSRDIESRLDGNIATRRARCIDCDIAIVGPSSLLLLLLLLMMMMMARRRRAIGVELKHAERRRE